MLGEGNHKNQICDCERKNENPKLDILLEPKITLKKDLDAFLSRLYTSGYNSSAIIRAENTLLDKITEFIEKYNSNGQKSEE